MQLYINLVPKGKFTQQQRSILYLNDREKKNKNWNKWHGAMEEHVAQCKRITRGKWVVE